LSLANVSFLVFDELCHGYYIHGRSVHGTADVNMDELNHFLRKEEVLDIFAHLNFKDLFCIE
jgi:meckelin